MRAEYKRDLQHNYLILEVPEGEEEDSYQIQMAEENEIPGLLRCHSSRRNGILCFYYEITSRQPLESLYERTVMGSQEIVFLLSGIRDVVENMQRYLLNSSRLVFDPEYIYMDPEKQRFYFCYFPVKGNGPVMSELAEFVLKKLDHEDMSAVTLGYTFYQKTLEENFSLQRILRELMEARQKEMTDKEDYAVIHKRRGSNQDALDGEILPESPEKSEELNTINRLTRDRQLDESDAVAYEGRSRGAGQSEKRGFSQMIFKEIHPVILTSSVLLVLLLAGGFYFGYLTLTETGGLFFLLISLEILMNKFWHFTVDKKKARETRWAGETDEQMYQMLQEELYNNAAQEHEIEETQCLSGRSQRKGVVLTPSSHLHRGTLPDIYVDREGVYIGKIKGESDVVLDSPTVSRRHARLECRNERYYVKDLNSKNGTFLNGERLNPQEQCEFFPDDEIAFSEITFRAVNR